MTVPSQSRTSGSVTRPSGEHADPFDLYLDGSEGVGYRRDDGTGKEVAGAKARSCSGERCGGLPVECRQAAMSPLHPVDADGDVERDGIEVVNGRHDRTEAEREVTILGCRERVRPPLGEDGVARDSLLGPDDRSEPGEEREWRSAVVDAGARPDDGIGVRELERGVTVEDADCRRLLHGNQQRHVGQRELGVLSRAAATEEERLECLGGEVQHAVPVHAADPAPLHRLIVRAEHAESHRALFNLLASAHGSVWTITSAIPGTAARICSSTEDAVECATARV